MAVAGEGAPTLLLYTPDLATTDTVNVAGALLPGERITHVVAGSDGSSIYLLAASDTSGAALTVRRRDGRVLGRTGLGGVPTATALHPDGHTLMVATVSGIAETQERSTLHFLPLDDARTEARTVLCEQPARAMAPFRVLDRLYVACEGGELAEVDTRLRTRLRAVRLDGACGPAGAGLSANGTLVYVLCRETGTLLYVDRARLTPFDSAVIGTGGSSLALSPDRRRAAVTRPADDEILVVDLRRRGVTHRVAFGAPRMSVISSDGRWAYVAGGEGVMRVNVSEPRVLAIAGPPSGATAVAVWPGHSSPIMRW